MNIFFIVFFFMLSINSQELSSPDDTYVVLNTIDKVEIREYRPLFFASYHGNNTANPPNSSFRVLAEYIFGGNEEKETIAMTSPVVIKLFENRKMLFRMPGKYNEQNIPQPNNADVKFISTKSIQKAVIKYGGHTNEMKEEKQIKILKNILDKYNIQHNNQFELFVYDPPYKIFNRRNEISVNIVIEKND